MCLHPHTSHVLQPLDVGLFGPLKTTLSQHQDRLFRLHVARVHKVEWLIAYVKARRSAFRSDNVFGGWRGAGLIPFDPERILRPLKPRTRSTSNSQKSQPLEYPSPPPAIPSNVNIFETSLITARHRMLQNSKEPTRLSDVDWDSPLH